MQGRITKVTINDDGSPMFVSKPFTHSFPSFRFYITFPPKKVLNMNPLEILSMIEEAAGTRMFETKKQAALKTMERKQAKNDEVQADT
jgi:hypothetical protein